MTVHDSALAALRTILPDAIPDYSAIAGGETVIDWPPERLLDGYRALVDCGTSVHLSAITALPQAAGICCSIISG